MVDVAELTQLAISGGVPRLTREFLCGFRARRCFGVEHGIRRPAAGGFHRWKEAREEPARPNRQGNSQLGQKLMRARVVVQGATVALMVGSAGYYGEQIKWFKRRTD
ncbi:hypothetical protein HPP92_016979 [Vanilla planifolia]|uniref:HIG1 domain-containing protein n=1 Tax=Vanilla planifolia TaxID=51239 RepID=A0A835QIK2_VANPL|nr:hypothetical protein HPP92_016979 [Vanilla planifolia]